MKDIIARWEKLTADADQCAMIASTSIDPEKRDLFALLSEKLGLLVSAAERVITAREGGGKIG
jgi:hypothetical protein